MSILDRYLIRNTISATVFVSVVVIGIQSFLSLIQEVGNVGQHEYSFFEAIIYTVMRLPATFYQLFPMAGFLGVLIALSRLAITSQLIVMRVSGVSILQIAWAVVKAAVVMIIIVTIVGECIGPPLQQYAQKMEQAILYPSTDNAMLHGIWLHHGDTFTYIDTLRDQHTLERVARYYFLPDGQLSRATLAENGRWMNGEWRLEDLKQTVFNDQQIQRETQPHSALYFSFQPVLQVQMKIFSAQQSLVGLYKTIHYRSSIGVSASQYVFAFWQRIFQPMATLIMMLLAVPFVFGSLRNTSMSMRMMLGIFIAFAFYMMNQLFGPITLVYQFPPILCALLPSLIFLGLMLGLLVKAR